MCSKNKISSRKCMKVPTYIHVFGCTSHQLNVTNIIYYNNTIPNSKVTHFQFYE